MSNSTDTSKANSQNNDFDLAESLKEQLAYNEQMKGILEGMIKKLINATPDHIRTLKDELHDFLKKSHHNYEVVTEGIENKSYSTPMDILLGMKNEFIYVIELSEKRLGLLEIPQGEWDSKLEEYQKRMDDIQSLLNVLEDDVTSQTVSTTTTTTPQPDNEDEESTPDSENNPPNTFDSDTLQLKLNENTEATSSSEPVEINQDAINTAVVVGNFLGMSAKYIYDQISEYGIHAVISVIGACYFSDYFGGSGKDAL